MEEDGAFAIPVSKMVGTGIAPLGVASYPSAGQGFSLNEQGHIPVVAQNGQWSMEIHTQAVNLGNHVAGGGGTVQLTIPGLQVGDFVGFMGMETPTAPMRGFIFGTSPVCVTEGEISFHSFNATGSAADLPERDFSFLVIHRHM